MTDSAFAFGLGVGTRNNQGDWLEVFFPLPLLSPTDAIAAAADELESGSALTGEQLQRDCEQQLRDREREVGGGPDRVGELDRRGCDGVRER